MRSITAEARAIVRRAGLYSGQPTPVPFPAEFLALPDGAASDAIVSEKVSSLLLARMGEHRPVLAGRLSKHRAFAHARARIEAIVRHKAAVLGVVDRAARELGIEVWGVKGLSAQRAYHDPSLRDLGDLDLMVDGVDSAIRLTERMIAAGYDFHSREWPWVKRSGESGVIYGQFSLKHGAPEDHPAIDLHFGGYSVRHCGLHPLAAGTGQPGLSYYGTQENLPLIVGNAAGDHHITTKDLNDLALAMQDPGVDWAKVLGQLDQVCLLGFFRRMLGELRATSLDSVYRESALRSLMPAGRPEIPAPHPTWQRQRRWAVTVLHAFAVGARHSYVRAGVTSLTAAHYYWGDRTIVVRDEPGQRASRLPALNSWTCVRLIPVALARAQLNGTPRPQPRFLRADEGQPAQKLSAELTVVRSPAGDVMRTVLGDFIPAVYQAGRVPDGARA